MGHYEQDTWVSDTGLAVPVLAVDCDGTINGKAEGQIGVDNGARWSFELITRGLALGCRIGIMTCNSPRYVAGKLQDAGIGAYADLKREYKIPPWDDGTVLVTDRKILADYYVDDRNVEFRYGQSVPALFARMGLDKNGDGRLDYDWRTEEYRKYVEVHLAYVAGETDEGAFQAALTAAQAAAERF